jgi:uncharacterized protein YndB with AHSA1/START domain
MNFAMKIAPTRKIIRVKASPAVAFEIFSAGMTRWWPGATHTINPTKSPLKDVVMEPRAGGRWYERGEDGSECEWGKVLAWEPPRRLLLAWQINAQWAYDPNLITEVEVKFIEESSDATRVELEHRNLERYGEAAEAIRAAYESPDGWTGLLERFAQEAAKKNA